MKTQRYKGLIGIILVLFFITAGAAYAQVEKTKRITKSYTVDNGMRLNFHNKFGKLHIDTHDSDQVEVDIVVDVDLRNESRAQQLLDRIDIDVDESSSEISYKTDIRGKINNKKGEGFSIDYNIKMPKDNPLDAKVSFGDMYVGDLTNRARLEIAYGSLTAMRLTGDTDLELNFSKGEVKELGDGSVIVKYGGLNLDKMGDGDIEQQFSDIRIEQAGQLEVRSKYGSVELGDVQAVEGSSNFTSFRIDQLYKSIDMTTSYGNGVEVRNLSKDFEFVDLRGKFGGYTIYLESDTKANIEVETSFSDFKYSGLPIEMNVMIKEMSSGRYKGT
ncbi:MAG: hypothetical protein AAGC88_06225, partial [Bacteroidota bacterium]